MLNIQYVKSHRWWPSLLERSHALPSISEDSCLVPSRILVVGGGITGLVTAWVLLDKGYHVTIVAKEWAFWGKQQRLTFQIAGAL